MKLKKTAFIILVSQILFIGRADAIVGFGLNVIQDQGEISSSTEDKAGSLATARMIRKGFTGGVGIGGYLYLDVIPVIDLEVDFEAVGNTYKFNFQSIPTAGSTTETGYVDFGWVRTSTYVTARKELFDGTVPVFGGLKLHAGGGLNFHKAFPLTSITMMETLLGSELYASIDSPDSMEDKIVDYINDNVESTTGIHLQAGVQLKLLFLDSFVNYRYTIGKTYDGSSGYGSLLFKVGMGF